MLEDSSVPEFTPDQVSPNWDNSIGLDAVLHEDVYLATVERREITIVKTTSQKPSQVRPYFDEAE
jgi:putative transposase